MLVERRNVPDWRPLAALAVAAPLCGAPPALGTTQRHAEIAVSATVVAYARLTTVAAPSELIVAPEDVARGFVEVTTPIWLEVASNSTRGFALDVLPVLPVLRAIEIEGFEGQATLGPEGGTLVRRWSRASKTPLALRVRLGLAPGVTAGALPWPLQFAVRPLAE